MYMEYKLYINRRIKSLKYHYEFQSLRILKFSSGHGFLRFLEEFLRIPMVAYGILKDPEGFLRNT